MLDQSTQDKTLANAIRFLSADAVQAANSGHPGMPLGMADVATVLFSKHLKFDASQPDWADRDRFVLSAGHGSMLLYSLLYLTGYPEMTLEQIKNFRQMGSITAGHPEYGHAPGIETTTGPLGQGLAMAVGLALGERMANARYGDDLVNHNTYVIAGDGCLMEGISQEAISFAGHQGLSKLIVLWDDNAITIDGSTDVSTSEDQLKRFEAAGWATLSVDGHDMAAIDAALTQAKTSDKPTLIACKTVIGWGAPTLAGTAKTHGAPLGAEEIAGMREALGWAGEAFETPAEVLDDWRAIGARGQSDFAAWSERFANASQDLRDAWQAAYGAGDTSGLNDAIVAHKKALAKDMPKVATRKASEDTLNAIADVVPGFVGGSADLTGSNNTKAKSQEPIQKGAYGGAYVHYGVREFAMGAIMNGLALHGGFRPYGGTFLVFSDYMRPAMRLAALMGTPVIYVLTHDSIGLGEDGPTHQPVEHVASLRAIPNLQVWRPADALETAEAWQAALANTSGPSVLALSRQGLPALRASSKKENLTAKGGYILTGDKSERDITLMATGSEVALAVAAAEKLAEKNIKATVVSMPCLEAFDAQRSSFQLDVLGDAPVLAIEAGIDQGWYKYADDVVCMESFGASAPAGELFKHFGFTADNVAARAEQLIADLDVEALLNSEGK